MRTLCYSVRLESLCEISEKAYKARSYDGNEAVLPKSCVFGQDLEVCKTEAYWIAAWILPEKSLQYSDKKQRWFDEDGRALPSYKVERHTPEKCKARKDNLLDELKK